MRRAYETDESISNVRESIKGAYKYLMYSQGQSSRGDL